MIDPELNERVSGDVQELLKTVAEEEGFVDYKIEKTSGGVKGDNYLGIITSVSINGTSQSKENKALHVVVKCAPTSDMLRTQAPMTEIYEREVYMYTQVFPEFCKFSVEKGLPPFSNYPRCYRTSLQHKSEVLILEDLKEDGYGMWDRKIPMDHDHLSFVIAEYGKLHAFSFALRHQQPERFRKLIKGMDCIFAKCLTMSDFTKSLKNRSTTCYEALDPVTDEHALKVFKAFVEEQQDAYINSCEEWVDDHSVIVHGDSWSNNMLFKYENASEPTRPTKLCLIDLQLSRIGPTVLDVSYFFYSSAGKEAINNYEHYLDVYYKSLSDYLRKLGSDPSKVYPYSLFRQEWKQSAKYGLVMSLFLIHLMMSEPTEAVDLSEVADSGEAMVNAFDYSISKVEEYNDRVRHIILHFVNNKLI